MLKIVIIKMSSSFHVVPIGRSFTPLSPPSLFQTCSLIALYPTLLTSFIIVNLFFHLLLSPSTVLSITVWKLMKSE